MEKIRSLKFPTYVSAVERLWHYLHRLICGLTLIFLLLPIFAIVPLSFSDSTLLLYPIPSFSFKWYDALFHSDEWIRAAKNSFIVAPSATLIATVLGTLAAAGLHRIEFHGKGLLMAILISPMIVPLVVVGVGIYLFFAPYGLTSSYIGLILAHAALGAPFVLTTVSATLQGFNENLVRASYSLGASPLHTFFKVTLPIIAPGIVAAAMLAFALSLDDFIITLFNAGNRITYPLYVYGARRAAFPPQINVLATAILLVSLLALGATVLWQQRTLRQRGMAVTPLA